MPEKTAKRRGDYKKNNRGLVFQLLSTGVCRTRSDLVQYTGLSKMAISNIISEMLQSDLLVETELIQRDESGRKPVGLAISPTAPKVVGLLIMREYCEVVLCELNLHVLYRERVMMQAEMDEEKLLHMIYQLLDTALLKEPSVLAIGISSIGPISVQEGRILEPYFFYGIKNVEIVRIIRERYHLPVFLDHDNQSSAMVEKYFGCGKEFQDILFVGIGSGVGCGILNNGQRFENLRGLPPELGHVSIDINGPRCTCGNRGCIECYIRTPELLKRLQHHAKKFYNYRTFCEMDDPFVDSVFRDSVEKLSAALISVINVLNSELIILGLDSSYWNERYITMLEDKINQARFVRWDQRIIVKTAYFKEDAALMGAACSVLTQVFEGELLFEDQIATFSHK